MKKKCVVYISEFGKGLLTSDVLTNLSLLNPIVQNPPPPKRGCP